MVRAFICGLALFGGLAPAVCGSESASEATELRAFARQSQFLARCETWLAEGRHDQVLVSVLKSEKKLRPALRMRADLLVAKCRLARSEPDKALERLKERIADRSHYRPELWECYDVAARAHAAKDEHYRALVFYDWMAQHSEGIARTVAAAGCGKALEAMKRYSKALASYTFALKCCQRQPKEYRDVAMMRRLGAARNRMIRFREMDLYGEDFVLYREAETLRRSRRRHKEALDKYREIVERFPDGIYAEAAGLYGPLCQIELGETVEAERGLAAFIRANKHGLYRGEALLEMGRLALERRASAQQARRAFDALASWLDEAPKQDSFIEAFSVSDAARKLTTPPPAEKRVDFWGNIKKETIRSGQLVNRRSCGWYLDDLREQCAAFRGFLFFVAGKKKEALECYERLLDHDAQTRRLELGGIWNNYRRLKWGVEHGYLYAYPQELRLYAGRQRLAVLLGDFYYLTERFERAGKIYDAILSDRFGRLAARKRQYPQYASATCLYWTRGREAAFSAYMKVFDKQRRTFTQDRAAYCAGNISRETTHEEIKSKGRELLSDLISSNRASEWRYKAWIVYARDLIAEGKKKEGLRLLKAFPKSAGDYWDLVQFYLSEYNQEKEGDDDGSEAESSVSM